MEPDDPEPALKDPKKELERTCWTIRQLEEKRRRILKRLESIKADLEENSTRIAEVCDLQKQLISLIEADGWSPEERAAFQAKTEFQLPE